jgi:hypothetical protein
MRAVVRGVKAPQDIDLVHAAMEPVLEKFGDQ